MSSLSDDTTGAVHEFAEAELGDLRRTKRLIELATILAQNPRASLPEARGNSAMLKAAYRFFANEAIEPQDIIHGFDHRAGHLRPLSLTRQRACWHVMTWQ